MKSDFFWTFCKYFRDTTAIIIILTLMVCFWLNVALLFYISKLCVLWYRKYQTYKQTGKHNFSQIQQVYYSFTKYFISILICVLEIASVPWIGICGGIFESLNAPTQEEIFNRSNFSHKDCRLHHSTLKIYMNQYFIFILNTNLILFFLQACMLSVLTRYLAARYLNNPVKGIFIKYTLWFALQVTIIAICSSNVTAVLSWVLFPILAITSWLLLLRDSLILSRVVRSNLQGLLLFSNSTTFRQQLIGYKIYKVFRIILLTSLLLLVSFLVISEIGFILKLTLDEYCLINLALHTSISPPFHLTGSVRDAVEIISLIAQRLSFCMYGLSISLPIVGLCISALFRGCAKRYKDNQDNYRFNYDKLEPFIGRYRTH